MLAVQLTWVILTNLSWYVNSVLPDEELVPKEMQENLSVGGVDPVPFSSSSSFLFEFEFVATTCKVIRLRIQPTYR